MLLKKILLNDIMFITPHRILVIIFINFTADTIPVLFSTRYGNRSATKISIKNKIVLIAECPDQIPYEIDRLLCRMVGLHRSARTIGKINHALRETGASIINITIPRLCRKFTIISSGTAIFVRPLLSHPNSLLRIIGWK